eukprot:m.115673 g.115673  ORF g.115673 m.115673 type:complete len:102 (-) comp22995_c0_seq6:265-570(-)
MCCRSVFLPACVFVVVAAGLSQGHALCSLLPSRYSPFMRTTPCVTVFHRRKFVQLERRWLRVFSSHTTLFSLSGSLLSIISGARIVPEDKLRSRRLFLPCV